MEQLPLEGIRVLDLSRALSGPFCATLLGDLGASVVKVETLPDGDMMRTWGPFAEKESVYFVGTNRNKRSIAIDLRNPEGGRILRDLVSRADVLVENFRPGVMDKLGLSAEAVARDFPKLILCTVSGYGPEGPLATFAGFDQIAQGMSGLMSVTGQRGGRPTRAGIPISDLLAGTFAALGVVATLFSRPRTQDHRVHASLLESVLAMMSFQAQRQLSLGQVPAPEGNDHPLIWPYGCFETENGEINIAVGTEEMWRQFRTVLDDDRLAMPEFATNAGRLAKREELRAIIDERLRTRPVEHWLELLRPLGIPVGPVYRMDRVFADPQVRALGAVERVTHTSLGPIDLLRGPLWLAGRPVPVRLPPPRLGEHTVQILREHDYDDATIDRLRVSGAIAGE